MLRFTTKPRCCDIQNLVLCALRQAKTGTIGWVRGLGRRPRLIAAVPAVCLRVYLPMPALGLAVDEVDLAADRRAVG